MRQLTWVSGFFAGMVFAAPIAQAICLPVNPITMQPCISHQGYSAGKSFQGNRHKHYFTNTCRQRLQITFEWQDAGSKKYNHKVLKRGRHSISCLKGACPGAVIWAPVCKNGTVGASTLALATGEKAIRRTAISRQHRPRTETPLDWKIIGIWDYKNTHDCPKHKMGCNGRYDFVTKKGANKYLFRGVISCRRTVKPGVKEKLQSEKTFTTYFDEIWTVNGDKITTASKIKPRDKNVSAITQTSVLRKNSFSGSGPTCGGEGSQTWTATKRQS